VVVTGPQSLQFGHYRPDNNNQPHTLIQGYVRYASYVRWGFEQSSYATPYANPM
jgi:hypothetical protein